MVANTRKKNQLFGATNEKTGHKSLPSSKESAFCKSTLIRELLLPTQVATRMIIAPSKNMAGQLALPSSKSQTMRALLFALIAEGTSVIENPLWSPDTDAMLESLKAFGATFVFQKNSLLITGVGGKFSQPQTSIHANSSGLIVRFFGALSGLLTKPIHILGDAALSCLRPSLPLLDGLQQLGCQVKSSSKVLGCTPFSICGPISRSYAAIDGEDSQPVSALLIAMSLLNHKSQLMVRNPGEVPWIKMTLQWLKELGAEISHFQHEEYSLNGLWRPLGFTKLIPPDLSCLAYPVAWALITESSLIIDALDMDPWQGDQYFLEIVKKMGAHFSYDKENKKLHIPKQPLALQGGVFNLNDCIDMVTIVAVLACFATSPTTLTGIANARNKESNRPEAIARELIAMGASIEVTQDSLTIYPKKIHGACLQGHKDHRMVMALTIAALGATGVSTLTDSGAVIKTFPDFFHTLKAWGNSIKAAP